MIKKDTKRRVVVTGLGVVSSLGIGWEEFWKNLLAGKSGISEISLFDHSMYDRHLAGEVRNFKAEDFLLKKRIQFLGRSSQMAIAAVKLSLKDAELTVKNLQKLKFGFSLGTTMGESRVIEDIIKGYIKSKGRKAKPILTLQYPANVIGINVLNELKLKGKLTIFANACAAGNYAVAHSFDLIRSGRADVMLAGGADSLSRIAFTGFGRLFAMAPEKCQPFDKNRKGMLVGEGSGILVLESLEHARKRKANIYAEVLGYGMSSDAHHMTNPKEDGVVKAIQKALKNSGVNPDQVDYISAHGTGTKENDKAEAGAINRVFGKRGGSVPVSSIKSMLGHTMGAASAFESIACCLALKHQTIPPTINFSTPDPECKINCVPNKNVKSKLKIVLNNSQAFGGNNAVLILRGINFER